MSNPKPLYTITPEQEKTALHDVLMRFDDKLQSYPLHHNSLSALVNDDVVPLDVRQDIVGVTLWNLAFDSFFNGDTSYSSLKNHFAKYANQSLVGTIAGVSITPQDFQKLITNDNSYVFVNSLPFSFMNEIEDRDQLFEKLIMDNSSEWDVYPEILLLNHYTFTDEQYKSKIKFSIAWEPGFLPLFAACPQTKHLVTQENFADLFDMILQAKSHLIEDLHNDLYLEFINDITEDINRYSVYEHKLTEAYRDLFNEEFVINTQSL